MNNKRPGEGLHILWEIISKGIEYRWKQFTDWLEAPRPCKKHGTAYLYQHGWYDEWDCSECRKEMHEDWMSKREDYLSEKCPCDKSL